MQSPVLHVENLSTFFFQKKKRLNLISDINFSLKEGKTLALVGESGCGKSMTALSILRILPRNQTFFIEGSVLFEGENLVVIPEKKMGCIRGSKIAMIFQDPSSAFNPVFSIGSQITEVLLQHTSYTVEEAQAYAIELLQQVGLPRAQQCFETYPHQLSGGMKQRAMIAMALSCKPSILIADEPTTSLDVTVQKDLLNMLKSIQKREKMAILLITHDMGVVAEMADEVAVMYASEIVESGAACELFDRLYHPYTRALFECRPQNFTGGKSLPMIKGIVPPLDRLPSGCYFHPRCPCVMDRCKQEKMALYRFDSSSQKQEHSVRCILYESAAMKKNA